MNLQGSQAENDADGKLSVTIQLHVPQQWYGQQGTEPIRSNVDGRGGIVYVGKCLRGFAFAAGRGCVPGVGDRGTLEDDVQQGDKVHDDEHGRNCIQAINVCCSSGGDTNKHKRNAQLDGNDCRTIEDFKEEKVLGVLVVVAAFCE